MFVCKLVFNLVLRGVLGGLIIILLSSCGVITKPVKLVTGVVVKPVKIVTDGSIEILRKPVHEAIRLAKPSAWVGQKLP